jgi:hypothetical protein
MTRRKPVPGPQIFGDKVVYDQFIKCKGNASKTSKFFTKGKPNVYPSRKQVNTAVERHLADTSAEYWTASKQKGGRPPILDHIAKDNLKGMARQSAQRRDFIRPLQAACEDLIHQERKKMLVRLGFETREDLINMRDPRYQVSQQTLDNYVNEIWPKKEKAGYIAARREEVKREMRNNISCAAVGGFVFSHTNPACCATSDHFAVRKMADGQIQVIRTAAGSKDSMQEQSLSAGHNDKGAEGASVTMPLHATMTKALQMVALVGEVWDDQILKHDGQPVKIYALDATDPQDMLTAVCFSAVIAHGTPHEVVMHKIYKDILIPKMVRIRSAAKAASLASANHNCQVKSVSVAASLSAGSRRGRDAGNAANMSDRSVRQRPSSPSAAASAILLPSTPNPGRRELQALAQTDTDTSSNLRLTANSRAAAQADPSIDSDEEDEEAFSSAAAGPWVGHLDEWDIVFCLDGDSSPLAAIIDKDKMAKHGKLSLVDIIRKNAATWGVVKFLKWAAACTPLQSPNDVGKTHMIGKGFAKVRHFRLLIIFTQVEDT